MQPADMSRRERCRVITPNFPQTASKTTPVKDADPARRPTRSLHAATDDLGPEAMIHEHLGLACSIARRYTNRGIDAEDLEQVAALALVLAAGRFDSELGHSFAAYAGVTIHGELKRHLRDHGWAVRPPRGLYDTHCEVVQAARQLEQTMATAPTVRDIAAYLSIDVRAVREAQKLSSCYSAASLEEMFGDGLVPGAEGLRNDGTAQIDALDLRLSLARTFRCLTSRERLLIQLRFEQELTQQQIGHRLGVSQMQVSRMLSAVIVRLRASLAGSFADPTAGWPSESRAAAS